MSIEKGYQPSPEEIARAEEMMTDEQRKMSAQRESEISKGTEKSEGKGLQLTKEQERFLLNLVWRDILNEESVAVSREIGEHDDPRIQELKDALLNKLPEKLAPHLLDGFKRLAGAGFEERRKERENLRRWLEGFQQELQSNSDKDAEDEKLEEEIRFVLSVMDEIDRRHQEAEGKPQGFTWERYFGKK